MAKKKPKHFTLNEYLIDLLVIASIAILILFVVNPNEFMSRLGYYLNYAYAYMKIYSKMAIKAILGLLIIGIVYWRILFHLRNSQLWKSDTCPRCKKNSLKRIHRTSFDRFLSNITRLHFRRFKCSSCSWTGLLRSSDRLHRLPDEFSPDETPGVNV